MNLGSLKFLLGTLLALTLQGAWACAICAPSAAEQTLTQRLFKSEQVVIARALAADGVFETLALVRGGEVGQRITGATPYDARAVVAPGGTALLARSGGTWRVVGALPPARAAWVQRLVALRRAPDANPNAPDANWPARFAFFAPDLENPVELVAQAAYEELSSAPYGAMRAASTGFVRLPLAQWLGDQRLAERHPLYGLMQGFVAQATDIAGFKQRLLAHSAREPLATASALMAALIEAQAGTGLAWVQTHYLSDKQRSDTEVQAALLAVRVHANDGGKLSKEAATAAIRAYIDANPARAGFAASDLGDWGHWEFGPAFERLLDTDQPQVFASRYAMVLYLLRSPLPDAKAALERLRAKGRL